MAATGRLYLSAVLVLGLSFVLFQLYGKGRLYSSDPPFKIVDLGARGKGLVATREISPGELILNEEPLFSLKDEDLSQRLLSTLSNLNKTARETFFYLSFPLDTSNSDIPTAILRTNGIPVDQNKIAILPLMSRINHGCSHAANAVLSWRDGYAVLYAIRPIGKGEEILREYLSSKFNRQIRRERLKKEYGFHCICSVCTLPPVESEKSDIRLSSIASIEGKIYNWDQSEHHMDPNEIVRLAERVWGLGEAEQYWIGRGRLAEEISALTAAYQDHKACARWAQLSAEWYGYEFGTDSTRAARMRGISSQPSTSTYWGTRVNDELEAPET